MALLIDGYNLLHASGILPRGLGPGTLERARGALLNFLVESLEPGELAKTLVVFDARAAPVGLPRRIKHRGLAVHFAPNPGDADALIEHLISADHSPRKLVVVSSDHRLQRAAKRRRAQAIDSDRWYAEIIRRRMDRGREAPDEPAKPTGPLSQWEVARWLAQFGMAPLEAGGPAAPGEKQVGEEETTGKGPLGPFPPGYGDDLWDEE
jgi:predicted RNA-binding protein with PIN domain